MKSCEICFRSKCKVFLPIILAGIFASGCSSSHNEHPSVTGTSSYNENPSITGTSNPNGDVGSGGSKESARASVISSVSELETKLKDYGVHFEVKKEIRGLENVVLVEYRVTANDSDLSAVGKKPEDRDQLLSRMSDLWQIAEANNLQADQEDEDTMAAVLKVELVHSKFMLPKFLTLETLARILDGAEDNLSFERDKDFNVSLFRELPGVISNGDAVEQIDTRLTVNKQFEEMKGTFVKPYITRLEQLERENDPFAKPSDLHKRIEHLREASNFQFLTFDEAANLHRLHEDLSALPANDTLDISRIAKKNKKILTKKRIELLGEMEAEVTNEINRLGLSFAASKDGVTIDQKAIAQARVRGSYFGRPERAQKSLSDKRHAYENYVNKYRSRSETPANEAVTLKKVGLFNSL